MPCAAVVLVVLVLTAIFLGLDALANHYIFSDLATSGRRTRRRQAHVRGSTVVGLSMFATLFLGVVSRSS